MMKKLILAVALFWAGMVAATPQVGEPAPAFTLPAASGNTVSLSDFRGQYVVLEWTNHECPFVKKHYGSQNMQTLQKYAQEKGAAWLTIISSAPGKQGHVSAERAEALTSERNAAPTAVLLDEKGEVGRRYAAKTTPHMYLVDPQGRLRYMGGIDSIASADPADIAKAKPYVRVALDEALAGKPVSEPVTRPYGCAVKY